MKAKLNWVAADDGAFWMNMTDFATHFDEVRKRKPGHRKGNSARLPPGD